MGGYFAGASVQGRRVDCGMVLYEFSSFSEPSQSPRLDSYDPMVRNDVGRFCSVIRRYIHGMQATRPISSPRMWVDGKILPDMMLANGMSALHHLSNSAAIHRELSVISQAIRPDTAIWHPANKRAWPLDGSPTPDWHLTQPHAAFDADTLSRNIHGQTLHNTLFAPFAHQVLNRDASDIAALYHRLPWLPLYWPQTLLDILSDHHNTSPLPATVFNYPVHGTISALCQQLALMVRSDHRICLIDDQIHHIQRTPDEFIIRTAQHGDIHTERLGWALTPAQGLRATAQVAAPESGDRLPLLMGFCSIPTDQVRNVISVLHMVSGDTGIYRITNSTACGAPTDAGVMHLVIEANPNRFSIQHPDINLHDDAAVMAAMLHDLSLTGVINAHVRVKNFEVKRFSGALPLPTARSVTAFLENRARLQSVLTGVELLAASAGPFAFGLSDQIVQGLQLAQRASQAQHAGSGRTARCPGDFYALHSSAPSSPVTTTAR